MNRFYLAFLALFLTLAGSLFTGCEQQDFVQLSENQFEYRGEPYFPLIVNYVLELRKIEGEYRVVPFRAYENPETYGSETLADLEIECRGHLQIMKDMGFNGMRLCMNRMDVDEKGFFYPTDSAYTETRMYIDESYDEILNAYDHYVRIAAEMDMKIMWLLRSPADDERITTFTQLLLKKFRNQPAIFAYDFINEPLYFDFMRLQNKKEIVEEVESWNQMMKRFAPNQLLTVGLAEPLEVFRWDPSILPVDFIAFHTYNPLRVFNEIYWYETYGGKPWMLGETGLQADGDSISYEDQVMFNRRVAQHIVSCGGLGMGIWEFQEVVAEDFEGNKLGLINKTGTTTSSDGKYTMVGTIKPAGHDVKNLLPVDSLVPCEKQVNYYNMVGYDNYVLRGRIINEVTNQPIEGAVVRGWNLAWDVGQNTFTNENGEFTLYSNAHCRHFRISAPGMEMVFFDAKYDYIPIDGDSISIENLSDTTLEYQQISYRSFMVDSVDIFDYKPELFTKAKAEAYAGDFYLRPALE